MLPCIVETIDMDDTQFERENASNDRIFLFYEF